MDPTRRRTRAAAALSAALLTAMSASACSGGSGSSGASKDTVTVWTIAGADSDTTGAFLASWSKANHTTVKYQAIPGPKLHDQLPIALRTGQGPDVFSPNDLTGLEKSGFLAPLDDVLSAQTKANYQTAYHAPSQFVYHGKLLAMPTSLVTMQLIYNKDLFTKAGLDPAKPPTTFSDVLSDAKSITAKVKGSYGYGLPLKFSGVVQFDIDPMIINGSTDLTQRGLYNTATHHYQFEKYEPAVTMFRQMLAGGYTYPGASSLDNDPMRVAFAQGKIGMYMGQTGDAAVLDTQLKTKVNWGTAPTPVPDGQTLKQEIVHVGGAWAMNAHTKHNKAAAKTLEALLGSKLNTKLGNTGSAYPASKAIDASSLHVTGVPQFADFAYKSGGLQRPAPNFPTDAVNVQGTTWKTGLLKVIEGKGSIKSALSGLSSKYNNALDAGVKAKKINLTDYGYPPAN